MSVSDSFAVLMDRLRSGEDEAAREVFARFAGRLMGLARRHLDARLAVKVDPEDVVQSAYKSFFVRQREGGLEVGTWDNLWGVLTMITLRKCADRANYHLAGRRDATREHAPTASGVWPEAIDREPSPEEAAELEEAVTGLLGALDPADRPVLELSLQGYTTQEIAERLDRPERTVRRLRERVRGLLEAG